MDSLIYVPERQQDFQSISNRENSSQENEIRDIDNRNEPVRESRLVESINMLSGEMNARMSREMEAMMDLMQSQISRAISSAISERIIPEIQNMVENLPLSQHGVEPCTSTGEDRIVNVWKNANTRLRKKNSRSACDLRVQPDHVPYMVTGVGRMKTKKTLSIILVAFLKLIEITINMNNIGPRRLKTQGTKRHKPQYNKEFSKNYEICKI